MNDNIIIGRVVKAVWIKGEIKVAPITDDMLRYKKLKTVYITGIPYQILSCRFDKAFVFLKLNGFFTRVDAEKIVGDYLEIDRVNAIVPENGYLIADIEGCKLFLSDGEEVGVITDVAQYGAADVFTIEGNGKVCRCPFLNKVIEKIDVESKIIVANKKEFTAVCVYED
ncbi:MAG: 16S rRNA processing protein RimM [Firmicutes bacterium]|nr:16S rRNA processing protein RimM [Bacillota bacterium]